MTTTTRPTFTNLMLLPPSRTCSDCQHFPKCQWLIDCQPGNTECDWIPNKFVERVGQPGDGQLEHPEAERTQHA
jgi:hypothetical protein